jgi:transcriptional regulator with XRE-family HTH domain
LSSKDPAKIEKSRREIAAKLRELRIERRWTQRELAARLDLSQSRLSEIENGSGSLTAEQFVHALRLFNASITDFVPIEDRRDAELQNALARFGAKNLVESETLVSGALDDLANVIREGLVRGVPRFVTALAPVLVVNVERLDLGYINVPLASSGFGRRLPWLAHNVIEAIQLDSADGLDRTWSSRYRRTLLVLQNYLELAQLGTPGDRVPWDILDPDLRSTQSVHLVIGGGSSISIRWRIASSLQPEDFRSALREARSNA